MRLVSFKILRLKVSAHLATYFKAVIELPLFSLQSQQEKGTNEFTGQVCTPWRRRVATDYSRFKQQLFGEKSEKRLIDNPDQLTLGEILKDMPPEQEVPTETITYERRKKQRPEDCVTDQGLRFNDDVPIKLIHLPTPELQGEDADQYEVIDHK